MKFQTRQIEFKLSHPVHLLIAGVLGISLLVGLVALLAVVGAVVLVVGLAGTAIAGLFWSIRRMFSPSDPWSPENIQGMLEQKQKLEQTESPELEMIEVEILETRKRDH